MVLFVNVNVGQRVEVKCGWNVTRGIVRYKGPLVGRKGDWVGVALDVPVGDCNGMIMGRRYFQCDNHYGIFVQSDSLRFIAMVRRLFNRYHKVSDRSYVDEPLFGRTSHRVTDGPFDPIKISGRYFDKVRGSFDAYPSLFCSGKSFPLRHSVGNHIPAATMLRPSTAKPEFRRYTTAPIHMEYAVEDEFIQSPSIPKIHMPHSALERQVGRGWEGSHYVREMTVGHGRDSMKFSQWNDISL